MNSSLSLARSCVFVLMLIAGSCSAQTALNQTFIEKPIGRTVVRLPLLPGFAPACEENPQLAKRAAGLAPKSSEFITCFVHTDSWRDFRAGRATGLYPNINVMISVPHPSGDYTPEVFARMKEVARTRLGELVSDGSAKSRIAEQDATMARSGSDIKRENYQQAYGGLFPTPQDVPSFGYLATRSATMSEAGASAQLNEVVAISTVLYAGRLLLLSVVDSAAQDHQGIKAREVTSRWLHEFARLNRIER